MGDGMQRTPGGRLIRYEIAKLLLEYVYWSAFCFDKLLSESPSFKASLSSSRPLFLQPDVCQYSSFLITVFPD